jgi:hypothetical protein
VADKAIINRTLLKNSDIGVATTESRNIARYMMARDKEYFDDRSLSGSGIEGVVMIIEGIANSSVAAASAAVNWVKNTGCSC